MIHFVLCQNKKGITRLQKFYEPYEDEEKARLKEVTHKIVTTRDEKASNFVILEEYNCKIVFRRYQLLYFVFGMDLGENELAALETIHLLVEVLDNYFGNVSEVDLIYNFHRVLLILDELIMAGELMETSKNVILKQLHVLDQLS